MNESVSVNGYESGLATITYGIPRQGSVLEPLLVLFYINNLKGCVRYISFSLFCESKREHL